MSFNPQLWSAETSRIMKQELQDRFQIINTIIDYTPFTKGAQADAYNGPYLGDIDAKDMPIDDGDFNKMDEHFINFALDVQKGVPVKIADLDAIQSMLPLRREYAGKAAKGLIKAYNLWVVQKVLDGLHSTHRKKKADSENDKLTEADFKEARKLLNIAGAPDENRYALVNATDEAELTSISNFISRDKMGETNIPSGIVGKAHGFLISMYSNMPNVKVDGTYDGGGGTKKANLFYQRNIFGWARQKEFGVKIEPKAGQAADLMNTWSNWGGKTHQDKFAVSIRDN
jgi:hypothetical protein